MTLALLVGGGLFVLAAVLGERNALWIPAVVLIAAGAAKFFL